MHMSTKARAIQNRISFNNQHWQAINTIKPHILCHHQLKHNMFQLDRLGEKKKNSCPDHSLIKDHCPAAVKRF